MGHRQSPLSCSAASTSQWCKLVTTGLSSQALKPSNAQVPEEQRPAYVKGQHLRGVDADHAERCRAEIVRLRV